VPYAIWVVVFVDWDVAEALHRDLTQIEKWPWGPAWTVLAFYFPLLAYPTACRFIDAGWARWIAEPFSILTLSPYLLLFHNHTMSFWLPVAAAVVLQLPAILVMGKNIPNRTKT
jgi:hypothetical protein